MLWIGLTTHSGKLGERDSLFVGDVDQLESNRLQKVKLLWMNE